MADDLNVDGRVFCGIVRGRIHAKTTARWDDALAFVPLNPVTQGHELVVPRRHVMDALEAPEVTAAMFAHAAEIAAWPCNLITSAGDAATQTVFHLHVHIVPRRTNDGLALPWTNQERSV